MLTLWVKCNIGFSLWGCFNIWRYYYSTRHYISSAPVHSMKLGVDRNAAQLSMPAIFYNLYVHGLIRCGTALFLYSIAGVISFVVIRIKIYMGVRYIRMRKYTLVLLLRNYFFLGIVKAFFRIIFGVYFFGYKVEGEEDEEAAFAIALHKDFVDGFLVYCLLNYRVTYDLMGINSVPMLKSVMEMLDCLQLDRRDPQSKRDAFAKSLHHYYDYEQDCNLTKLFMFPEGALSSKATIREFKPGPFCCLKGVQYLDVQWEQDYLTGVDISNCRGYLVFFLLWISKSYSIVNIHFKDTIPYESASLFQQKPGESADELNVKCDNPELQKELKADLKYQNMLEKINQNKDFYKLHSNAYAKQAQQYVLKLTGKELLEDVVFFDGFDVKFYRDYVATHISKYWKEESLVIKQKGFLNEDDYFKINKKMFREWVLNYRTEAIRNLKIQNSENMYRSNEWILTNLDN